MNVGANIKFGAVVVKGVLMSVTIPVAGGMARKPTCWMLTHTVGAEGGHSL